MRISFPLRALQLIVLTASLSTWHSARAWGEEGHTVVALIAEHYLQPAVRERVKALLDGDTSGLVADKSMASESVWADRYRDSDRNGTRLRYEATRRWHYVDIELDDPSLPRACSGQQPLPAGTPASAGAADDCVVDKIDQFQAELSDAKTSMDERRLALQFLLHLVGDMHQPLHAADENDQGGNQEQVDAPGLSPGNLHRYWDTEFVQASGSDPRALASTLIEQIQPQDLAGWQKGSTADWAMETYQIARRTTFGLLPAPADPHHYHLSADYVHSAADVVKGQLQRAGVRLALILNRSLG